MTREEAKQLLPIIQAYAEGKTIQVKLKTDSNSLCEKWVDVKNPDFDIYECYRIKPSPKYRPFKNAEECWQEMQKHQPFGWVKDKSWKIYDMITRVTDSGVLFNGSRFDDIATYSHSYDRMAFADGTPFGMKEGTDD